MVRVAPLIALAVGLSLITQAQAQVYTTYYTPTTTYYQPATTYYAAAPATSTVRTVSYAPASTDACCCGTTQQVAYTASYAPTTTTTYYTPATTTYYTATPTVVYYPAVPRYRSF